MTPNHTGKHTQSDAAIGIAFGLCAIVLWSFTASFVALGADAMGVWAFLAVAALTGGALQMTFRWLRRGELRSATRLPGRLWVVTVLGFVLYGVVYPLAIALARTDPERCGVNLINYLWPTLTVVCGVLWVPPNRFRPLLLLAILCGLAGTGLANVGELRNLITTWGDADATSGGPAVLPYLLALLGAVVWAVYSSLLARWRAWTRDYSTSAIGLLIIGVIAGAIAIATEGTCPTFTTTGLIAAVLCGLLPNFGGYMLWELALVRADVRTLGLMGAATPILSTVWLCVVLQHTPGPELLIAAALIGVAVVLSTRS